VPSWKDPFLRGFLQDMFLNTTCYSCPFQRLPRLADVTLGDCWGVPTELYDARGVSLVAANTEKARARLAGAADGGALRLIPYDIRRAAAKNPRLVIGKRYCVPRGRRALLHDVRNGMEFGELVDKHYPSYWRIQLARLVGKAWRTALLKRHGL